jgi:hypothetical protein
MELVRRGDPPAARALAAGHSTVLRSEVRSLTQPKPFSKPVVKEPVKKGLEVSKPKVVPKQRIVLPKDLREQDGIARRPGGELARAVLALFLMAGAVFLSYGTLFFLNYRKAHPSVRRDGWEFQTENKAMPPRSYIQGMKKSESPDSYWASQEKSREADLAPAVNAASSQTSQWKHPIFLRGAMLFNDALAKYNAYLADRNNPNILKPAEQQCRDAIAAFESCRSFAPPEVRIEDLINEGYRLISDCRQSTLMNSAKSGPIASEATSPLAMTVTTSSPSLKSQAMEQLILAPTWNNPQSGDEEIIQDLKDLLSGQGQSAIDLKPDSTLVLFGRVCYLMPLKEAVKILGKPVSPRKNLNCPGFPKDSLFYCAMEGSFGGGFNKILLITDSADRIAAVELVNEHPDKSAWLDPSMFSEKWRVYDFVQTQTKGNAKWRVGHRVETVDRIVRIDSELVANDEFGYFGLGASKERVSLYMPQPLVNLILLRLEKRKE